MVMIFTSLTVKATFFDYHSGISRAICYLTANTHYNSSALISECNVLSQFIEDIGRPSVPVCEFNLITCPLE